MKKVVSILLFVAILSVSTVFAATSNDFDGDCSDIDTVQDDWWGPPTTGNYGGRDLDEMCVVWEPDRCDQDYEQAHVWLDFDCGCNKVCMNLLDGQSDLDSFDVYVDDTYYDHYSDDNDGAEAWKDNYCFKASSFSAGTHKITIKSTENSWPSCDTYGQIAIDQIWTETCPQSEIPEFGVLASVGILAVAGVFIYMKRRK